MTPPIDPRLAQIDDALYRIATRVLVIKDKKVLLVREKDDDWWSFPGGGIDYGETIREALVREAVEELGVSPENITIDNEIAFISIGAVVSGVPRCNIFYKVEVPEDEIKPTDDVFEQKWFSLDEFPDIYLSPGTNNVTEELQKIL